MKASDLFVKCLEAEGVTAIYGVPGEENADFMISLEDSPIDFILTATDLTFEAPDRAAFPCLDLGYDAGRSGGSAAVIWLAVAFALASVSFLAAVWHVRRSPPSTH